jgi:hypothetical protein
MGEAGDAIVAIDQIARCHVPVPLRCRRGGRSYSFVY